MSYTQEQLKEMTSAAINGAVKNMLFGDSWHKEYALFNLDYCTDWSVTGPLMAEYGVSLSFSSAGSPHAYSSRGNRYDSCNPNPLRAVCEVILMREEA